jgi:hypothetical protein
MWIVFHARHLTRRLFKIMDFATVALFDDLLPSAGEQLPQISMHCWITHRVFHGAASGWHPSTGDRARGIHVCVYVERHCHPWLQEFTSSLVKYLRFSEASNAGDNLLVWSVAEYQSGSSCCSAWYPYAIAHECPTCRSTVPLGQLLRRHPHSYGLINDWTIPRLWNGLAAGVSGF